MKISKLPVVLLALSSWAHGAAATAEKKFVEDACASVRVAPPFTFKGKRLEEIPDIREPELRLANQLLSSGCMGHGYMKIMEYRKAHPMDVHYAYGLARWTWMYGNAEEAEELLRGALVAEPKFHSAKMLLAGIRIEQRRHEDARKLVDEVEKDSPTDLWAFMNRNRFEARERPTMKLRARMMEILRNPAFPPNAREVAAEIGMSIPRQSNEEVEEFMWARMDFESSVSDDCKISALAQRLSEIGDRFEKTRELLESERARGANCQRHPLNRILLAQAYLMKAATLSPVPSAANQALIDKATAALQADYPALREYVAHRPQAKVLEPFLDYRPKPELPDADGRTPLCNAVRRLDIEGVLEILNHGADPNGRCEAYTMLGHVMLNNPNAKNAQRQAVTRILMSRGAEPSIDEVTYCGQAKYGDCSRILLPIVERRAQ